MKIFLTGGTGVVGTRALPALVAAGHQVTAVARGDAKAELVALARRRAGGGRPVRRRRGRRGGGGPRGRGPPGHQHPAAHQGGPLRAPGARTSGCAPRPPPTWSTPPWPPGPSGTCRSRSASRTRTPGDRWIDEDHPVDHVGPVRRRGGRRSGRRRGSREGGGHGVVLRFAQFYAPESSHTQAFNALVRRRLNPFLGDARRLHVVHPRRRRRRGRRGGAGGVQRHLQRGRRRARHPTPRPAASWPTVLGRAAAQGPPQGAARRPARRRRSSSCARCGCPTTASPPPPGGARPPEHPRRLADRVVDSMTTAPPHRPGRHRRRLAAGGGVGPGLPPLVLRRLPRQRAGCGWPSTAPTTSTWCATSAGSTWPSPSWRSWRW